MTSESLEWLLSSCEPEGSAARFFNAGLRWEQRGERHLAATACDRALGTDRQDATIAAVRQRLLDSLSRSLAGITFRYIPASSFLMGSEEGRPDESPVHAVQLDHYWISETPVSWACYCQLMDWTLPPAGSPQGLTDQRQPLILHEENKIRLQYCEDQTLCATRDWHAHVPEQEWVRQGKVMPASVVFGKVSRLNPELPWKYEQKPMVAVSWQSAEELCQRLSQQNPGLQFHLPTEVQWEKAARGGALGAKWAWGNEPPDAVLNQLKMEILDRSGGI